MTKTPLLFSLFMLLTFTDAVYIATNGGLCATYVAQRIGVPVTFVRCESVTIRQSTWQVVTGAAGQPAGTQLFCINSEQNLCIGDQFGDRSRSIGQQGSGRSCSAVHCANSWESKQVHQRTVAGHHSVCQRSRRPYDHEEV